ncbi:MAG TPA: hypothetical protein DIW47_04670 [Bacteroidetes bacterium]|nr:hypothetical protein [Bacteroidota bacterium]
MNLIPAYKKGEALVAEMDSLLNDGDRLHLWWLGQSGFLLQWNGKRMLIDPYLSDSLTKKYADTDKPHIRMSELVVKPSLLRNISVVSSSHNHTDHLDADTLLPLIKNNPGIIFLIPEANRDFVANRIKSSREFPVGIDAGHQLTLGQIRLHGIPAKHNEIEKDEKGRHRLMGYVIEMGKWKIYHSGDTLWFDELVPLLSPFRVDIAILPINGNDPSRKVAGNLDCREAARLGQQIGAKMVVPCHYDMFTFNTADVNEFAQEAESIGQAYTILRGGEQLTLV